jgi:hypothetical protein
MPEQACSPAAPRPRRALSAGAAEQGWISLRFEGGAQIELDQPETLARVGAHYRYATVVRLGAPRRAGDAGQRPRLTRGACRRSSPSLRMGATTSSRKRSGRTVRRSRMRGRRTRCSSPLLTGRRRRRRLSGGTASAFLHQRLAARLRE